MKRFFAVLLTVFLLASLLVVPVSAANEDLHISDAGLEMIMDYEGFRSMAYEDGGKWYIGYGTGCGQYDYPYGITQEQAKARIDAQKPDKFYRKNCTFFLENRAGSMAAFERLIGEFLEDILIEM